MLNATKFLNNQQIKYVCKVCNLSPKDLEHVSEELDEEISDKLLWKESELWEKGMDDKDVRMAINIIDIWDRERWNYLVKD